MKTRHLIVAAAVALLGVLSIESPARASWGVTVNHRSTAGTDVRVSVSDGCVVEQPVAECTTYRTEWVPGHWKRVHHRSVWVPRHCVQREVHRDWSCDRGGRHVERQVERRVERHQHKNKHGAKRGHR